MAVAPKELPCRVEQVAVSAGSHAINLQWRHLIATRFQTAFYATPPWGVIALQHLTALALPVLFWKARRYRQFIQITCLLSVPILVANGIAIRRLL